MAKPKATADRELAAMAAILSALNGLDGESIQRVFDYVVGRLSLNARLTSSAPSIHVSGSSSPVPEQVRSRRASIRDLKEEKQPESANQMAALVAYYLSEIVEGDESKPTINTGDLEKYFKQAGFRLPKAMPSALTNAERAGYFDAAGNGQYRLNAVGYNLIAHGLPRAHGMVAKKKKKKASR